MASPFRNDRDAALERAARLEAENAELRARLEEAKRPRKPRSRWKPILAVSLLAFVAAGALGARAIVRRVAAQLEARRWAGATEQVRFHWKQEDDGDPDKSNLLAAWSGPRGTFAVGAKGKILFRSPDGVWSEQPTTARYDLRAVDGGLSQNTFGVFTAYAVGDLGTILRYDGMSRSWAQEASGTSMNLHAVAVVGNTAFAAGDRGTLLRRDGAGWTAVDTHTSVSLRGLYAPEDYGMSGHTLYVVGDGGTILYMENLYGAVDAQRSGIGTDLLAIGGSGDDVVIGGTDGTLLRGSRDPSVPWVVTQHATERDIVAVVRARETFQLCTGSDERRFLDWAPAIFAVSQSGDIVGLDVHRGWVPEAGPGGATLGATALPRLDQANDELLLLSDAGQIVRGVPHP